MMCERIVLIVSVVVVLLLARSQSVVSAAIRVLVI